MSDDWPPPGHSFYYRMDTHLDGGPSFSMDVALPSARPTADISTFRLGRHGGPNESDLAFRERLYSLIGAIVVAGGHVEAAMKRLILLLKGDEGGFSVVDKTWTDLHKLLVTQSRRSIPQAAALAEVLKWGDDHELKRRRDDAVHASWWNWDGVGVIRSRFFRKQDGASIVGSFEGLEEDARLLFEYAQKLDVLLGADWPQARLPRQSS
ncbi:MULTISPECIES: hypothetical protein [Streptomyces]|uniref:hypothetical protein n=1 Tax=Streptomyces TaxID=1883 RepID=UPI00167EAB84|nr:hypothetical protein [Streptomyces griseosporeus]GHF78803.1 hypothetical protein GCM10018783_56330 [Streptomyces griseosporeus]